MNIEEIIKKVNKIIKDDKNYNSDKDLQVQYILLDKNNHIDDIVCFSNKNIVSINPDTFEFRTMSKRKYNYDTNIFEELKDGKTIGYMSDKCHYDIWTKILAWYPSDIDCKKGLDLYIKYCDINGITKEHLDKMTQLDVPDIMTNFEKLEVGDTLEYKGYIAYVDEPNLDNEDENIIYIYENMQDYTKGEYIEGISLDNKCLKTNIKNYIDEIYAERKNYNYNMKIIDKGFRKDQPVALVEREVSGMNEKDYIIAFHYDIDDNHKLSWGYGFYYNNKELAEKDFKKVLSGKSIYYKEKEDDLDI